MSQEFKVQRYCGRRLSPGAFHHHSSTPRIPGWLGQEIPTQQAEGEQRHTITVQPVSGAVEARQDTLLICIRRRSHRSHPSKLQQGGTTGHTERNGYGPAAQRRKPASKSWTTGAEERPAWLSAQLCREERSQRLSGGKGTPGHLQLSMLLPLLSLLRAPGSTLHCNAPLSPFKSTASLPPCLPGHKHCIPGPTLVCNHHVTGISHNSYHKLPFTCCGLASLSHFPLPEASPLLFGSPSVQQEPQDSAVTTSTMHQSTGTPVRASLINFPIKSR